MQAHLPLNRLTKTSDLFLAHLFPDNIFDLLHSQLSDWISNLLDRIEGSCELSALPQVPSGVFVEGRVFIAQSAIIEHGAYIRGPAFIGPNSEVRHGAYIRGNVYVGRHCVVGHATEIKSACLLDGAKAGHFAYIGDSVLCQNTNLGAGTKIANLKLKKNEISFKDPDTGTMVRTGLKKFGALLGDDVQTGCNSVISPGSVLLPSTGIYPNTHFSGTLTQGYYKG